MHGTKNGTKDGRMNIIKSAGSMGCNHAQAPAVMPHCAARPKGQRLSQAQALHSQGLQRGRDLVGGGRLPAVARVSGQRRPAHGGNVLSCAFDALTMGYASCLLGNQCHYGVGVGRLND